MSKKVSFSKWDEFLSAQCKQEGTIHVIMGISMVSHDKAVRHYQNGETFQAFCEEILKVNEAIQPKRTLELTVVLTGALHRHNIAIQNNTTAKEALGGALKKDTEWLYGNSAIFKNKNDHPGLRDGHRSIMESVLKKNGIPYKVVSLAEWLFKNGEKTAEAEESFTKMQALYNNDKEFKTKVDEMADEKVEREFFARFKRVYSLLDKNIKTAKEVTSENSINEEYLTKNQVKIGSNIGQLQSRLRDILKQEAMLKNEGFLTSDEEIKIKRVLEIKQTQIDLTEKYEALKNCISVSEILMQKVRDAFLESARNYLLEEASTVFLFNQLGNQSFGQDDQKSNCCMTYKDNQNPVFHKACKNFKIKLPFLPYKLVSPKKEKGKAVRVETFLPPQKDKDTKDTLELQNSSSTCASPKMRGMLDSLEMEKKEQVVRRLLQEVPLKDYIWQTMRAEIMREEIMQTILLKCAPLIKEIVEMLYNNMQGNKTNAESINAENILSAALLTKPLISQDNEIAPESSLTNSNFFRLPTPEEGNSSENKDEIKDEIFELEGSYPPVPKALSRHSSINSTSSTSRG